MIYFIIYCIGVIVAFTLVLLMIRYDKKSGKDISDMLVILPTLCVWSWFSVLMIILAYFDKLKKMFKNE